MSRGSPPSRVWSHASARSRRVARNIADFDYVHAGFVGYHARAFDEDQVLAFVGLMANSPRPRGEVHRQRVESGKPRGEYLHPL